MSGTIGSSVSLCLASFTSSASSRSVVNAGACGLAVGWEVFCVLADRGAELEVGWENEAGAWRKVPF